MLSESLIQILACPWDRLPLERRASSLVCPCGHEYPIVDEVPVFLLEEKEQTIGIAQASLVAARSFAREEPPEDQWFTSTLGINAEEKKGVLAEARQLNPVIDPVVKFMIGATNGMLYRNLIGKIGTYTIPELRLPAGEGKRLLDIGCNWGRWSVAAARLGYRPVGLDPSLGAVLAARRVCRQLGVDAEFVVGDARFLPFADRCIDNAFSYSVIQHLSKQDARVSLAELGRVLKPGGESLVQMPNTFGVRCLFHQVKRRFRKPMHFEVRYWTVPELRRAFSSAIGPTQFSVDCFFGIGLQAADIHLMTKGRKSLIRASEFLRRISRHATLLTYLADSVYVTSIKSSNAVPVDDRKAA